MSQFPARETLTQAAERAGATPAKLADPTEGRGGLRHLDSRGERAVRP